MHAIGATNNYHRSMCDDLLVLRTTIPTVSQRSRTEGATVITFCSHHVLQPQCTNYDIQTMNQRCRHRPTGRLQQCFQNEVSGISSSTGEQTSIMERAWSKAPHQRLPMLLLEQSPIAICDMALHLPGGIFNPEVGCLVSTRSQDMAILC